MRLGALIYVVGFVYNRILSGPDYDFIIINIAQIIIIVNMPRRDAVGRPVKSFLPSFLPSAPRQPARGARHTLGPQERVETTKTGGWYPRIVPSESRFGPPSPRYGRFAVSGHFGPQRPKMCSKRAPAAVTGC
jgi:hypothetical protein